MALQTEKLDARFESGTTIARDLKLNFKKFASDSTLSPEEAAMVTLSVAKAVHDDALIEWARVSLTELGTEASHIVEAEQSAALMGMLNSYYKFRSFISGADAGLVEQHYNQAGLRMTALARPELGKARFELLALAVSVVNGCETCVTSHENVLRQSGVEPTKIHDAVRLAAVIKAMSCL